MPTLDRIAKTIIGPNEARFIGDTKLYELQDMKWGRLKPQQQAAYLRIARFVLQLFEHDADGYVILNGDSTKARTWSHGDYEGPAWTTDLDKALWFVRRDDGERFAKEDEDSWCIMRVSEVHKMWAIKKGGNIA